MLSFALGKGDHSFCGCEGKSQAAPEGENAHFLATCTVTKVGSVHSRRSRVLQKENWRRRRDLSVARRPARFRERPGEARLPLSQQAAKLSHELSNRDVKIWIGGSAMDVAPGEREACARGKAGCGATMAAQDNFRGECIVRESNYGRDLFAGKATQGVTKAQMMSGDVDW